jgi:hypothetical protein
MHGTQVVHLDGPVYGLPKALSGLGRFENGLAINPSVRDVVCNPVE